MVQSPGGSGPQSGLGVADAVTQDPPPVLGEAAHHLRERVEVALSRNEDVETLVVKEIERDAEPAGVIPARSPVHGDAAHLATPQGESAGVEGLSQGEGDGPSAVPAQLDHRGLDPRHRQGGFEPLRVSARVEDEIGILPGRGATVEFQPQIQGHSLSGGIDVHQAHPSRGDLSAQPRDEEPHDPAPDHDDPVAHRRSPVPHRVEGGLHVRREHGALRRQAVRQDTHGPDRHQVEVLVGVEAEDVPPDERGLGPVRRLQYLAHAAVPIFYGSGKVALLERRPHHLVLGRRHLAPKDQRFRASADAGVEGAHEHMVRLAGTERGRDDLSAARSADPELASGSRHERSRSSEVNVGPMSQTTRTQPPPPTSRERPSSPVGDVALGILPLLGVSLATCWMLALPTSHVLVVVAPYAALGGLLLAKLPPSHPGPGLGPANRVTLARATLVLPLAALALLPGVFTGAGYWWIVGLSATALVLDGVDGPLARRTGTESAFGARFDMELDAFLLMALSALVWRSGKVGSWVLLVGGLRYFFVLGGLLWPPLRGTLPPSRRRKVVCVAQGVVLVICLAPVTGPAAAAALAASALLLLVYSFVVDTWWLARSARPGEG